MCQSKIQDHASASDKEVASAIEYIAESIPSLILQQENGPDIFMGGFKSALNLEFLKSKKIGLIICAAKNLAQTFGLSYQRKVQKRNETLPHIQVVELPWVDNMQQILEQCELKNIIRFLLLKFNFFNGIFYRDSIFLMEYFTEFRSTIKLFESKCQWIVIFSNDIGNYLTKLYVCLPRYDPYFLFFHKIC